MAGTVRVHGYREFQRAAKNAPKDIKRETRKAFARVGDLVKDEAAQLFESIDARSAAGFKTRVRQRGVAVEQSLRKTTGTRPDFGGTQMRVALVPALEEKEDEVERELEDAIDTVADLFVRR
jgi:F0F1-type ATP synthase membrane subunit b/b'